MHQVLGKIRHFLLVHDCSILQVTRQVHLFFLELFVIVLLLGLLVVPNLLQLIELHELIRLLFNTCRVNLGDYIPLLRIRVQIVRDHVHVFLHLAFECFIELFEAFCVQLLAHQALPAPINNLPEQPEQRLVQHFDQNHEHDQNHERE